MKTVHRTVFKGYCAVYCNKEGRSCPPLLETALAVSHLLLRFGGYALCSSRLSAEAQEGYFAVCGRRPKGSALWTSASWAQLDQL
ncbi:MAG: hypothetical protein HDT21_09805 [Ruminococcus sp.]|nr:hypothetical protein [Ruminococcus sp.]